jgi:hypothetical protein
MAALVELKQRAAVSVGAGAGFVTPASVTPVIAAQGGGMGRSGRLLAAVMSCGLKREEEEEYGITESSEQMQPQNRKGPLQHLRDLNSCDASTPEGRRRLQRVLTRMLKTQVRWCISLLFANTTFSFRRLSCTHFHSFLRSTGAAKQPQSPQFRLC